MKALLLSEYKHLALAEAPVPEPVAGEVLVRVRKGGRVTLVGNVKPNVVLPLQKVVSRQLLLQGSLLQSSLLQGSCASSGEYPQAIEWIADRRIRAAPLITIAPLSEGPRWFDRLYCREPNLMKVVLSPEQ